MKTDKHEYCKETSYNTRRFRLFSANSTHLANMDGDGESQVGATHEFDMSRVRRMRVERFPAAYAIETFIFVLPWPWYQGDA